MKIYAFHLLNDLSGSPKVLSQVLRGLVQKGEEVHLVSSMKQDGFLTDIPGVNYIDNGYAFHQNVILRLFRLFYVQLHTIFKLYPKVKKSDVIYVNTVLPFGAAILGKMKGCKVVYHLHETSMKPAILKKFLFFFVKKMASEVVYVSEYLAQAEPINVRSHVVYNALESTFFEKAKGFQKIKKDKPTVLMICSLKAYKGIHEFYNLAQEAPFFDFQLVLNADQKEINSFYKGKTIPPNLTLFPRHSDVSSFYQNADLLLSLSRPDEWVETFGLTAIEAMAYGVPAIVPPVGGIAELIKDGYNGYRVSCYEKTHLKRAIIEILKNESLFKEMSKNALNESQKFSEQIQVNQLHKILVS